MSFPHPINVKQAAEYVMQLLNDKHIPNRINHVPQSYGLNHGLWIETLDQNMRFIYVKYDSKSTNNKIIDIETLNRISKFKPLMVFADSKGINGCQFKAFQEIAYEVNDGNTFKGFSIDILRPIKEILDISDKEEAVLS